MKEMSLKEKLEYENSLKEKRKDIFKREEETSEKYNVFETIHRDRFRELTKLMKNEQTIENLEKLVEFYYEPYCYEYNDYPKLKDNENGNKEICKNYYEHHIYEFECIPLIQEYNELFDKSKPFSEGYYAAKDKYVLFTDPQTSTGDKIMFGLLMLVFLIPVILVIASWGKGDWLFKIIMYPLAIYTGLKFFRRFNTNIVAHFVRKKLLDYEIRKRDLLIRIDKYIND